MQLEGDCDAGDGQLGDAAAADADPRPSPLSGSAGNRKRRKERKGYMTCPGCDEQSPVSEFALNQRFENKCKKLLDRIYNQARLQGQLTWFAEQKRDPIKCKKMLDYYRNLVADDGKPAKFSVAHYEEGFRTEQGVQFAGEGEMMWEAQAVQWWQTIRGGSLSLDAAQARWDDWAAHYKERGIIHDFNGSSATKPLRLRVPTRDTVNFLNKALSSKAYTAMEAASKKPKKDDLEKMHGKTLIGFERIGNGSASMDSTSLAQSMVGAGAGEAFDSAAMNLPDITALMRHGEAEEDAMDEIASASPSASASAGSAAAAAPRTPLKRPGEQGCDAEAAAAGVRKKPKWFDLGASINSNRRTLRAAANSIKSSFEDVTMKLRTGIAQVNALSASEKKVFAGEVAVCEVRKLGCELVMGTSEAELKAYILSFQAPASPGPAAADPWSPVRQAAPAAASTRTPSVASKSDKAADADGAASEVAKDDADSKASGKPAREAGADSGAARGRADSADSGAAGGAAGDDVQSSVAMMAKSFSRMPPCGAYQKLVLHSLLESTIDELDVCTDDVTIKAVVNKFSMRKLPLTDLLGAASKAAADLAKARKAAAAKDKKNKDSYGAAALQTKTIVFEEGPALGKEIVVYEEGKITAEADDPDALMFDSPFLITASSAAHKAFVEEKAFMAYFGSFADLFKKQTPKIMKDMDGRSACRLPAGLNAAVRLRVKAMCPGILMEESDLKSAGKEMIKDALAPSLYGICAMDSFGTERNFAPCLRYNVEGNRKIILTPFYTVVYFMKSKDVQSTTHYCITEVREYFQNMTKDLLTQYISEHGESVQHVTVASGSALFLPAGFLFAERCPSGTPNFGVRVGCCNADDDALAGMKMLTTLKEASGQDAAQLKAWCAELSAQLGK